MKCISFKKRSFSLPMQVLPSPEKPLKQEQQYEPWVLMQLALKSHNCSEAVHSSTSGTNRQLHLYIYILLIQGKMFKTRQIPLRTGLNRKKKSLCHVAMVANFLDLNKPWSCKYGREKERKINLYDLFVHVCTQEQNGCH